jgi:hypothetical protein
MVMAAIGAELRAVASISTMGSIPKIRAPEVISTGRIRTGPA